MVIFMSASRNLTTQIVLASFASTEFIRVFWHTQWKILKLHYSIGSSSASCPIWGKPFPDYSRMRYSKLASPQFTYYLFHLNFKRKARHTQKTEPPNQNHNPKLKNYQKTLTLLPPPHALFKRMKHIWQLYYFFL